MHCTNIFPLISPSCYYAARSEGVPVVQSLHNYRLLCVNSLLMRQGQACEQCMGKRVALPGVRHGCYRGSRMISAVVAALQSFHWAAGTWTKMVDLYLAMTEFARQKFIAGGLPADKIAVKQNFIAPDPGPGDGNGGYAVYVGRLSHEKGIAALLSAWRERAPGGLPLRIVGDGPMAPEVGRVAAESRHVEWLGYQQRSRVHALVKDATLLVAPSTCYEGALPRTILEAFAAGTPIVASRVGSMAAEIKPGKTGSLFRTGDPTDLAEKVKRLAQDPAALATMRRAVRREFEAKYTPDQNHELLMSFYRRATQRREADLLDERN